MMIKGTYKFYANYRLVGQIDNLILGAGLELFGTTIHRNRCSLGNGLSPAEFTDTDLENEIIDSTVISGDFFWYDENPFRVTHSMVYDFIVPPEGIKFTEAGIGAAGQLLSRARVSDANGFETSIKINGDETLRVVHSITYVPSVNDHVFTAYINGTNHVVTIRSCNLGSQSVWRSVSGSTWITNAVVYENFELTPNTGSGNGSGDSAAVTGNSSDAKNGVLGPVYELKIDVDQGDFVDGIGGAVINTGGASIAGTSADGLNGRYQIKIDPPIRKTADERLTIILPLELI